MVYILKINILYLVPFRSSLVYYIHYQSNRTPATSGRGKGQRRGLMLEMKFHLFSFLLPPQITVIFLYDSFHTFLGEEGPSILDRLNLLKSRQKNLSLSSSTLPHMIPVRQKYWIHLSKMYILPKVCVWVNLWISGAWFFSQIKKKKISQSRWLLFYTAVFYFILTWSNRPIMFEYY